MRQAFSSLPHFAGNTHPPLPRWLRASGIAHGRHEADRLAFLGRSLL